MKISINAPLFDQPYGGGMGFLKIIKKYLESQGAEVINHLASDDIQIILHLNVTYTFQYTFYAAWIYKLTHPKCVIIHRVNDSGLHRSNECMNHLINQCSRYSDFIVYNSDWLWSVMYPKLKMAKPWKIIYNGADSDIFNNRGKKKWCKSTKLKIVTHHWSSNYHKGHDIYKKLDSMLGEQKYGNLFEFTYIGNFPSKISYKNIRILNPMDAHNLGKELKKNHIYLSASRNEAGPMHVVEGALSGLPLLYIRSGATPEYCSGYGVEFDADSFAEKLLEIRNNYDLYYDNIKAYRKTGQIMAKNYFDLFNRLILYKSKIRKNEHMTSDLWKKYYFYLKDKLYKHQLKLGSLLYRK